LVAGHLRGDDGIVQAVKMTLPDGYERSSKRKEFVKRRVKEKRHKNWRIAAC
jgi:hypothetical protein